MPWRTADRMVRASMEFQEIANSWDCINSFSWSVNQIDWFGDRVAEMVDWWPYHAAWQPKSTGRRDVDLKVCLERILLRMVDVVSFTQYNINF
jgi:hypothetical protein